MFDAVVKRAAQVAATEMDMSSYVPYVRHVDETTVALASGALLRMWRVEGLPWESVDQLVLNRYAEALNNGLRSLSHERIALWTHIVRLRQPAIASEPTGTLPFVDELMGAYESRLAGERLYRNHLYVSLVVAPSLRSLGPASALRLFSGKAAAIAQDDQELIADHSSRLEALLRPYRPQVLGVERHNGVLFSRTAEALRGVLTGSEERVGLVRGDLGRSIVNFRPIFGAETIEIREATVRRFVAMLSVGEYPAETRLGMCDAMLSAPCQMVVTQSFKFLSKAAARELFGRRQNQMSTSGDKALTQAALLETAADDLESNAWAVGQHHLSVAVIEDDPKALAGSLALARRLVSDAGIVASREDLSLIHTYFAQLPGNFRFRVRRAEGVTSQNFTCLSPLHSYSAGRRSSLHWDRPVAEFRTSALARYAFNLHVRDVGHTLILGATGAGKSVLLNFALAGLLKLGATEVIFDKDRSTELFVGMNGGRYLSLHVGQETGAAPLKAQATYTDRYRAFLVKLVSRLVAGGAPLSAEDSRRIAEGVASVERLPAAQRSMGVLRATLGGTDADSIGARLERWCRGHELGWVLDGETDRIGSTSDDWRLLGIDLTELLRSADAREPMLMYLFERLDQLVDGRRLVWAVEEFHAALGDPTIRAQVDDALRTWRKRNAMAILVSQNPTDAINSAIGASLVQQTPTKIYLPNPSARREDYVDRLNCLDREYRLIAGLGITSRKLLVRQSDPDEVGALSTSVLCDLDLSGLETFLRVLSPQAERGDFERWDRVRAAGPSDLWRRFNEGG
jgi:type IV secretion system protein VirB4